MTERNLMNAWFDAKTGRRVIVSILMLYIAMWAFDAIRYGNGLDTAIWVISEHNRMGAAIDVEVYVFWAIKYNDCGLLCMIATTMYFAITAVHRESFRENWYVTLPRIPNYRGKYLRAKLITVLFPGALYVLFCALQCLWRRGLYEKCVPKELRMGETVEVWKLLHEKSPGEIILYILLFAVSMLLGSLVLRNVKKDIPGAVVAFVGIGMAALLFLNMTIYEIWQHPVLVLCLIVAEVLFLVRHVYRRL